MTTWSWLSSTKPCWGALTKLQIDNKSNQQWDQFSSVWHCVSFFVKQKLTLKHSFFRSIVFWHWCQLPNWSIRFGSRFTNSEYRQWNHQLWLFDFNPMQRHQFVFESWWKQQQYTPIGMQSRWKFCKQAPNYARLCNQMQNRGYSSRTGTFCTWC